MLIMEKSPSIVHQTKWKLSRVKEYDAFSSSKIKYKKNDSFRIRVGYKNCVCLFWQLPFAGLVELYVLRLARKLIDMK